MLVLGIESSCDETGLALYDTERGLLVPVLRDVDGNFVRSFGTTGVPETFVIDRHGRIAAVRRYQLDARWLDRTLPPLLAEPS